MIIGFHCVPNALYWNFSARQKFAYTTILVADKIRALDLQLEHNRISFPLGQLKSLLERALNVCNYRNRDVVASRCWIAQSYVPVR